MGWSYPRTIAIAATPASSDKAHRWPSTLHARLLHNPPLLKHKNPVILIHNSTLFGLIYALSLSPESRIKRTRFTAEALRRKWITFEINQDYLSSSIFRFLDGQSSATMKRVLDALSKSDANYFINKTACALNPINKAKSKA